MTTTTTQTKLMQQPTALQKTVRAMLETYFDELGNKRPTNLYDMFLEHCEEPLFTCLMEYTGGNQCEITRVLGISRGTVRKKLKQFGFIERAKNRWRDL